MTSFVIASTDKKKRDSYINNFCTDLGIDRFDITTIQKDNLVKQNLQSIGIEEIKNIHKKIFLKPLNSPEKAVVIEEAHLLTHPAQNALLKVLEEPPDHTYLILSTDSKESLLPTIISRCKLIELEKENTVLSNVEKREFLEFIDILPEMKIGDRLKKAEELSKDKDQAIQWVEKLIVVLRDQMLQIYSSSKQSESRSKNQTIQQFNISWINLSQELHTLLKTTNINPRLAIENTLLSLNS